MRNEFFVNLLKKVDSYVMSKRFEYYVPEILLFCILGEGRYVEIGKYCNAHLDKIREGLQVFLDNLTVVPNADSILVTSEYKEVVRKIQTYADHYKVEINIEHILLAMLDLGKDSTACYLLSANGITKDKLQHFIGDENCESENSIKKYSLNMNEMARQGKYSRLIGREKELTRIIQILHKKRACNPVLLGSSGSGKTAIVEGLAQRIVEGNVPPSLKDAVIWSVNLASMLAGTKYRGQFEERLTKVIKEITRNENAIVFIDEIHTICGAGSSSDSSLDASNILKPYLTNRLFRCIGATTYDEYRKSIEKDKALSRRFKKVDVSEPSMDETFKILSGLRKEYEDFHHVTYNDEILHAIISLTDKYMTEQYFPDKAIEVMDELGTRHHAGMTDETCVSITDVESLVSMMANVPSVSVREDDREFLRTLSDDLKKEIFHQDEAIDKIVRHLKIAKAGLGKKGKPLGVFGLAGPTGTGKTELVKQIASKMGAKFLRFDMSEYSEKDSIAKLIGSPPGYVGFEEAGALTEAVIRSPSSVILFDEIEKADECIYNLLLQVMDDGRLTDSHGRTAVFSETVIFMTSNVGSRDAQYAKKSIGFNGEMDSSSVFEKSLMKEFPPEFRNRFTEILQFNSLDFQALVLIVEKEIRRVNQSLEDKRIEIQLSGKAALFIAKKAEDENMGGRPVERLVNSLVSERIIDEILFGNIENKVVYFDLVGESLEYKIEGESNAEEKKDIRGLETVC